MMPLMGIVLSFPLEKAIVMREKQNGMYKLAEGQDSSAEKLNVHKLFIRGLPDDVDETHIRDSFIQYGPIVSVEVVRDTNGAPRGFGFVEFKKRHSVRKASVQRNYVNGVEVLVAPKVANKTKNVAKDASLRLREEAGDPNVSARKLDKKQASKLARKKKRRAEALKKVQQQRERLKQQREEALQL
eukprot:RCo017415